jgi:putative oxidoreductase
MITHGWSKYMNYSGMLERFQDPLGLMSPSVALPLLIFAELICAFLVAIGLTTRFAAFPIVFAMSVAAFVAHAADPLAKKEMALLYLFGYFAVLLAGPGRFSLDHLIRRKLSSGD